MARISAEMAGGGNGGLDVYKRQELFQVIFGYIKAQLTILGIVLIILWVGLMILRVDYALALHCLENLE